MSSRSRRSRRSGVDSVPVAGLSMFDRVFLGMDEDGHRVEIELVYRNMLIGGEPGGGKSVALNNIVAHAAMSPDCRLWLFDGKQVELGLWSDVAEVFVGNDITEALAALRSSLLALGDAHTAAAAGSAPTQQAVLDRLERRLDQTRAAFETLSKAHGGVR